MALTRQPSRNVLVLQNSGAEVSTAQNISPFYQWVVNGELTFPQVESQDALHQVDGSFLIHQVRVSAKEAGTSTYNIRILSHDVNGGSEVVLVDEAVIFSVDKGIHLLPVLTSQVPENSTLEMTIFEQTVGTPAKDVTASLIGQPFTGLTPLQNGHKIQDDADIVYAQRENLKFGDGFGITDDLGNDNSLVELILGKLNPIGSYKYADLTEGQFQAQMGTGWVLADGRSVVGSSYESITSNSNIPDARATYLRMKDNGAGLDPNGDPALGSFQDDELESHNHGINTFSAAGATSVPSGDGSGSDRGIDSTSIQTTGGNETRPKTTITNIFIRIN